MYLPHGQVGYRQLNRKFVSCAMESFRFETLIDQRIATRGPKSSQPHFVTAAKSLWNDQFGKMPPEDFLMMSSRI